MNATLYDPADVAFKPGDAGQRLMCAGCGQIEVGALRAQLAEAERELVAKEAERAGMELERNNAQHQHTTQRGGEKNGA